MNEAAEAAITPFDAQVVANEYAKAGFDVQKVLAEFGKVGFCDPSVIYDEKCLIKPPDQIPEAVWRAIETIETKETFDHEGNLTGYIRKVRLCSKLKALEMIGRNLRMFPIRVEHVLSTPEVAVVLIRALVKEGLADGDKLERVKASFLHEIEEMNLRGQEMHIAEQTKALTEGELNVEFASSTRD